MKRIIPLILFALVGCHRKHPLPLLSVTQPSAYTSASGIVLAMGQSNMAPRIERTATPASSFQEDHQDLLVINCAFGSTDIASWQAPGVYFQSCLRQAKVYTVPVVGIIFYQGETDALEHTPSWDQGFTSAVQGWRSALGDIPIVYAQIATNDGSPQWMASSWDSIKDQQSLVHVQNALMVKTDDQPLLDDVHLTTEGVVVVGKRMSVAFNALCSD